MSFLQSDRAEFIAEVVNVRDKYIKDLEDLKEIMSECAKANDREGIKICREQIRLIQGLPNLFTRILARL